jgi:WD40 repeat protein
MTDFVKVVRVCSNRAVEDTRFVQWNSDGSLIATVIDNNLIEIKDASDLQTVYSLQYEAFVSVDWHPTDPKLLAIAPREHGRIETRNVETGGLVSSITVYAIGQEIYTIKWSPDGSLLAAGMGASGGGASAELRIWDVSSGMPLFSSGAGLRYIYDVKWNHDGTLLATQTGGDNVQFVIIWDISDQSEITSLYGNTYEDEQGFDTVEPVILGDWHPTTNEIATFQSSELQLRTESAFQPARSVLVPPSIYDMAWSPNGDMLALAGRGEISFLDSETFTIFSTIVTESSASIRSISRSRTTNRIVFALDRNGIQIITPPSR